MKVDTFYKKEPHSSNTNRIFQEIYFQKETSKQEISRRLSLSLPTVAQSLKELYGMGIIEKNGYFDSTGGRKAQVISVAHQSKIAVGVSLLRERIMMTAMDLCGNPFKEKTIMIPFERSEEYYKAFGTAVNQFVDSLKCPDDKILGIGLAVQGLVSRDGQTIINGDILGYTGTDRSVFQKNIRLNCTLFHDTEVAAFAELWQYPDIQNAVYVALNKNLGGALIMGRQVYIGDGLNSCVLEHMRLIPGGRRCYCGQRGCLECYCSINSLEEDAGMDVDSFFEKLNAGDPHCAKVFDNFLDHPFMMFGLPGAALAMYRCARNEKKKVVGGLLLSAALTAFLTGITEPLEFTFLFVAPILYVVHCVLAGISFMLMHIFGVGVGMTFSGGLIDMTLFGIMQGNAKTHWIYIVLVGIVYFFVYWGVFTFLIKKFNFKTPGREADNEETKLYTRSDVNAKKSGKTDMTSVLILKGLGGKENIADIDCCATRLRITVHNSDAVSEDILKQSGAAGVIKKGNGIQVIYGPRVTVIKSHLEDFMESKESVDLSGYGVADNEIQTEKETAPKADGTEIFLSSPIRGKAVPLEKVDDEVFSAGILGQGIAIEPSEGKVFAPVDGVVENIPKSKHAIAITADNDANILIHVGLDTVELDGNGFDVKVANGAKIKKGDLLMTFNLNGIKKQGYNMITPIVVCNADEFAEFKTVADGDVNVGDDVIRMVR